MLQVMGFFFSPIKYYKIIFFWLGHTFEKADLWIHMKKDRKVYQEKIFFHASFFLLEIAIKGITSSKFKNNRQFDQIN